MWVKATDGKLINLSFVSLIEQHEHMLPGQFDTRTGATLPPVKRIEVRAHLGNHQYIIASVDATHERMAGKIGAVIDRLGQSMSEHGGYLDIASLGIEGLRR